jgi:hypothetical protein
MKVKILILTVTVPLLALTHAIACTCGVMLSENLREADFIGHVKFLEIRTTDKNASRYEATFDIIEKFKGPDIYSIWIVENDLCDKLDLKAGDELVIFSRKDNWGYDTTGFCSSNFHPNREYYSRKLEVLKSFKKKRVDVSQEFLLDYENSFFNRIWGLEIDLPDKSFALYEVTYDRLNFFADVNVLESFGPKTDRAVISLIQKADWIFHRAYYNFTPQLFTFYLIIEKEQWKGKYVTKYDYM